MHFLRSSRAQDAQVWPSPERLLRLTPLLPPNEGTAMSDSLFSKIIRREIPADIVFEDDDLIAFRDIAPQAPVHVLFVPKQPHATLNDVPADESRLLGRLMLAAADYARREGFAKNGYRVLMNCNRDGGQTVFHIHLHLLAGRQLGPFG